VTECKLCGGTGWIIVERADGVSGAKVCDCRRTQKRQSGPGQTNLTPETAALAVEGLCETLDYAPRTEVGKAIITNALMSMCSTFEQATWLIQRACTLHTKWSTCGLPGLRQILCSKCAPKDGISVSGTEAYPEGVPSERPPQLASARPALPAGRVASASLSADAAVLELAEAKRMPSPREQIHRACSLAPIIPESRPDRERITQADVEREIELRRAERAQRELGTIAAAVPRTPEPESQTPSAAKPKVLPSDSTLCEKHDRNGLCQSGAAKPQMDSIRRG
jgi:hypothetical protein